MGFFFFILFFNYYYFFLEQPNTKRCFSQISLRQADQHGIRPKGAPSAALCVSIFILYPLLPSCFLALLHSNQFQLLLFFFSPIVVTRVVVFLISFSVPEAC